MSWLFSKTKKVPKVPLPEGHEIDEQELRFPSFNNSEKIIQPNKIKEAAGFENPLMEPPEFEWKLPKPIKLPKKETKFPFPKLPSFTSSFPEQEKEKTQSGPFAEGPVFVKVDVYQKILGKIDELGFNINHLGQVNQKIGKSEYNEEASAEKLRKSIKSMHDKLLKVDKELFKG